MKKPPDWTEGMHAETPLTETVRVGLDARLDRVVEMAPTRDEGGDLDVRRVHQLRVSTRRAAATLRAFKACVKKGVRKDLEEALREIRRAAGPAREADVHAEWVAALREGAAKEHAPALAWLAQQLDAERESSREVLAALAEDDPRARLKKLRKRALGAIREPSWAEGERVTLLDGANRALLRAVDAARDASEQDLSVLDNLHELRIRMKRLRYALETFAPALPERVFDELYPRVEEIQEALGALNDAYELAGRVERSAEALERADDEAQATLTSMRALHDHCAQERDQRASEFVEWWRSRNGVALLDDLERTVVGPRESPVDDAAPPRPAAPAPEPKPSRHASNGAAHHPEPTNPRLAAIDIGTNTIRLIIAEIDGEGGYRVLDDEKEIARLGQGLSEGGAMLPEAMERAATTIASMMRIAEGYGAQRIRAVGTAVLRSATNQREFLGLVRERAGVEIDVISAEEEARLNYDSAAKAFDVESLPTAIVDIGGGSTEIVLTAGGLIERIYTIDIGAVRVTERFGGAEEAPGPRFDEMRDWVDARLHDDIGKPPFEPQMLIGAGGTFEALAKMDMLRNEPGATAGMPSVVRGYDLDRNAVRSILDWLRAMTLAERRRVPGLSPQRADIIVAGVTLVDRVMRALDVRHIRVHDGGIRDGLLLRMARELDPKNSRAGNGADARDPMRAVRQFAASCNFDRRHCDHVAGLALRLFDQLSARLPEKARKRLDDEARLLLHAAGELHDVGYHINYEKHHRHSYHLIMHSGMSGFTPRQVEVIACVARYHRGSKPKDSHAEFTRLSESDQSLVRTLSAVLRVADGLDRTHMQNVSDLRVRVEPEALHIVLHAPKDPSVDIWGAERKSALFDDVFGLKPAFEWRGAVAAEAEPRAAHSAQPGAARG
ncbi:MAG: CHAD domain-containing protein [Phycisphaerales bacterium]|nr:MAG: CHAD domain-containing protein [Phycisphaerales bacterium]